MGDDKGKKQGQEIATLGDRQVFVIRDDKKVLRAIQAQRVLTEKDKEIVTIPGSNNAMVTVGGMYSLNQIAGINLLTPPTCVVDGVEQSNPHVERHKRTKVIQTVTVRKLAFGYSPLGNIVAIDKTLFFNIFTYFLQDLQSKVKKFPSCGILGIKDQKPGKILTPKIIWKTNEKTKKKYKVESESETVEKDYSKKQMVFYEIEDPVGIWVDITHPEIQGCFDQHTQRQKFGDRHAQSICERNCLAAHPAIATKSISVVNGKASVWVYGWKHDLGFKKLNEMAGDIASGKADSKTIEVEASTEEAKLEDVQAAETGEGDEFGASPVEPEEAQVTEQEPAEGHNAEEPPAPEEKKEEQPPSIDKQIIDGAAIIGKVKFNKILKVFSVKDISGLTAVDKVAVLTFINKDVDKENAKEDKK